ncbi:putative uncharacterized protein [Xanthomonas citri pv. mangiferaeindicae LMG 941]|nr:putative uncharacterized protein [Xanthomonas citri pv. mangiferaeindicae LMG 941]
MLHRNLRAGRRRQAAQAPAHAHSLGNAAGARCGEPATAQCKVRARPTARHRSCLFCYTCALVVAYGPACLHHEWRGGPQAHWARQRHVATLDHHATDTRLTQARMQTGVATDTPMCRRPCRLHRCCITFRWAFVRSTPPPPFTTRRWARLAMCGCGRIWSRARATRRSATAGQAAKAAWR